jgi:hypothetical protein
MHTYIPISYEQNGTSVAQELELIQQRKNESKADAIKKAVETIFKKAKYVAFVQDLCLLHDLFLFLRACCRARAHTHNALVSRHMHVFLSGPLVFASHAAGDNHWLLTLGHDACAARFLPRVLSAS